MASLKRRIEVIGLGCNIDKTVLNLMNEKTKFIRQLEKLEVEDKCKSLSYGWAQVTGNTIKTDTFNNQEYKYLEATAYAEIKKANFSYDLLSAHLDLLRDTYSWKEAKQCKVVFIDGGNQFACISGAGAPIQSIKTNLFESRKSKKNPWDGVEKELAQYRFDNNFYLWLFSQNGKTLTNTESEILRIVDICGWVGSQERNEGKFSGECDNIQSDVMTSAFMASKDVKGLTVHIGFENKRLIFGLLDNGAVEYSLSDCGDYSSGTRDGLDDTEFIMLVYLKIIPFLREQFNSFIAAEGQDGIDAIRDTNIERMWNYNK